MLLWHEVALSEVCGRVLVDLGTVRQWTVRGDTVRVGCLNRINGLNGSAAVMQTRLSWSRRDLGKVGAGVGGRGGN